MDLNKFASGTYAAKYKNWGVNLVQRRQIPHLPRYLHSLLFGMQMWHLPCLLHIYSAVSHFCDMFARSKFVQIHFFVQCSERLHPHMASTPGIWTRTTFDGRRASALITTLPMFKKRINEAIKIYCRATIWNRYPGYELPATYRGVLSRDLLYKSRDKTSSNISWQRFRDKIERSIVCLKSFILESETSFYVHIKSSSYFWRRN